MVTRFLIWFGGILVLLVVVASYILYTTPVGEGEYRASPNNQYCAFATTYEQRRLLGGTRRYQAYRVIARPCEQERGNAVWYAEYDQPTSVLDYGARDLRFITWAPTNDSVTFVLDGSRSLTIPVP